MKNSSFSLIERKLIRITIVLALIQLVITLTFVHVFRSNQQINVNDTKQIDIVVDDVYHFRVSKENCLCVVSSSAKYVFKSRSTFEEYSVEELYESIHKGDKLSLIYRETYNVFWKVNIVVDARNEFETYRTIEEYNEGKQYIPWFVVFFFSIAEIVLIGIIFVYVWVNYNLFKGVYRKIQKRHIRKKRSN